MDIAMLERYGRPDLSTEVPALSIPRYPEFPPLSQQPMVEGCSMPPSDPVDQLVLEKCTANSTGKDDKDKKVEKYCRKITTVTEKIISYGIKQTRHAVFIIQELKLLLTHEETLLHQVLARIDKFKNLMVTNKKKVTDWEAAYNEKLPDYEDDMLKLVNVPQSQVFNVKDWPVPVQQKILLQIVSRTTNIANRVMVQLAMELTVATDIDLTLADVRKQCIVMMRQIHGWLGILKTQECLQKVILNRWHDCKIIMTELTNKVPVPGAESTTSININVKQYEDRLSKLEYAICCLAGTSYGTCKNVPPSPPCPSIDGTWCPGGDKPGGTLPPGGDKLGGTWPPGGDKPGGTLLPGGDKPGGSGPPGADKPGGTWPPGADKPCGTWPPGSDKPGGTLPPGADKPTHPAIIIPPTPPCGPIPPTPPTIVPPTPPFGPTPPTPPTIVPPTPPFVPTPPDCTWTPPRITGNYEENTARSLTLTRGSPSQARRATTPTRAFQSPTMTPLCDQQRQTPAFQEALTAPLILPCPPSILLPNQDYLQGQTGRKRSIEDLESDFRNIRTTLTEEVEKAVRLSEKLQRNMQCMNEARR